MKIVINCGDAVSVTDREIKASVPNYIMEEIKRGDNRKLFAYIALHEGHFMTRNLATGEPVMLTLTAQGITSAFNKISIGTPLIEGHRLSSAEEINSIGAVVGKFIKGQNIVIVCHGQGLGKYHAISIEMKSLTDENQINSVEEVYCFAMLKQGQKPALYNAYKVSELAAESPNNNNEAKNIIEKKERKKMPLREIKDMIQENGYLPSQVFNIDEIKKDKQFETLLIEKQNLEKELETLKQTLTEKEGEITKIQSMGKLNELITEGYSEQEVKFIKYKAKKEAFTDPQEFIKNALEEYREFAPAVATPTVENTAQQKEQVEVDNTPVPSSWNSGTKKLLDASTQEGMQAIQDILNS